MNKLIILFLFITTGAFASYPPSDAETAALKFNQWYISQVVSDKNPLMDYSGLKPYVTRSTIATLKSVYSADPNDSDMPDADMFIQAQDYDPDWINVSILSSDWDGVCNQVYVAFGTSKKHVVIDCMVKENDVWKVQSVAARDN